MTKIGVREARIVDPDQQQSVAQRPAEAALSGAEIAAIFAENRSKEKRIRELAFSLYEQRGRQDGHDIEDWLEAETVILSQTKQVA